MDVGSSSYLQRLKIPGKPEHSTLVCDGFRDGSQFAPACRTLKRDMRSWPQAMTERQGRDRLPFWPQFSEASQVAGMKEELDEFDRREQPAYAQLMLI
jgi:hypothetical protein